MDLGRIGLHGPHRGIGQSLEQATLDVVDGRLVGVSPQKIADPSGVGRVVVGERMLHDAEVFELFFFAGETLCLVVSGKPNNSASSGLVRVDPVAGTAVLIKAATTSTTITAMYYAAPAWSLDGTHLVALKRVVKKSGAGETSIVRMKADGTEEVAINVLGNVGGGNNFVWDWVSDDIAP